MAENKILGYTNPTRCACGPLVTIVKKNNSIGAIFPDCSFFYLDICSTDCLETFTPEKENRSINPHQYAYLSANGAISVMNENMVIPLIESDIKAVSDMFQQESLAYLLHTEKQRIASINPLEYVVKINNISNFIKIFFTDKNKSNGEVRKRLIIQHCKNGAYKTDYKKNLRISDITNMPHDSTELKRISKSLRGVLKCLAYRYKEEYSGMLICA